MSSAQEEIWRFSIPDWWSGEMISRSRSLVCSNTIWDQTKNRGRHCAGLFGRRYFGVWCLSVSCGLQRACVGVACPVRPTEGIYFGVWRPAEGICLPYEAGRGHVLMFCDRQKTSVCLMRPAEEGIYCCLTTGRRYINFCLSA